mmetsp:Transcript_41604/g.66929  ORF Transcript_41604/g.66929 Transcript_41604/m.66929 type:complete len:393 (+) Transcript_41604:1149-2327(+)
MRRWIQCGECLKWRRETNLLPVESLQYWTCADSRDGRFDHASNPCEVEEEQFLRDETVIPDIHVSKFEQVDKEMFYKHLFDFRVSMALPNRGCPYLGDMETDLYRLYREVTYIGGYESVDAAWKWPDIFKALPNYNPTIKDGGEQLRRMYRQYLQEYEIHFFTRRRTRIKRILRSNILKQEDVVPIGFKEQTHTNEAGILRSNPTGNFDRGIAKSPLVEPQAKIHNNESSALPKSNQTASKESTTGLGGTNLASENRNKKAPISGKKNAIFTTAQKDQNGEQESKVKKEKNGMLNNIQQEQQLEQPEQKQQQETEETPEMKEEPVMSIKPEDPVSVVKESKLDKNEEEKVDDSTSGKVEEAREHNANVESDTIIDQHAGLNELASRAAEVSN